MTSELNKEAAELMKQGKSALKPAAADKARVLAALQARLPTASDAAASGTAETSATTSVGVKGVLLVTGVVAAVAAMIVVARQPSAPESSEQAPTAAEVAPLPTAVASLDAPAETVVVSPATTTVTSTVAATPAPKTSRGDSPDRLAEEVALLTRAERAYHAGDLSRALSLVDQHRREFPRGTLGQERVHLRLQVLCGLGRVNDAKAEQARLERLAPGRAPSGEVCGRKP